MTPLIVDPKLADRASDLFLKSALPVQYRLGASSTASSEIMSAISKNHGMNSDAKGIVMSLPIDSVMGL